MTRQKKARASTQAESNHTRSKLTCKPIISKYARKQYDTTMGQAFAAAKRDV